MNVRVKRFQYHITQQWKSWLHLQVHTSWIPHIFFYFNIKVYAGRDMSAPRLVQLCHKQTTEQVLTTTGNLMYVIFRSDVSINGKGFSASYKSIVGGKCYF